MKQNIQSSIQITCKKFEPMLKADREEIGKKDNQEILNTSKQLKDTKLSNMKRLNCQNKSLKSIICILFVSLK